MILDKNIAEFFGNSERDGSSFMIILTLDVYDGFSQHLYHPSLPKLACMGPSHLTPLLRIFDGFSCFDLSSLHLVVQTEQYSISISNKGSKLRTTVIYILQLFEFESGSWVSW